MSVCPTASSEVMSGCVGRLEGDGLLGDRSTGGNCCGNHLDYGGGGRLEARLFVKNGIRCREILGGLDRHVEVAEDHPGRGDGQHQRHTAFLVPTWCLSYPPPCHSLTSTHQVLSILLSRRPERLPLLQH